MNFFLWIIIMVAVNYARMKMVNTYSNVMVLISIKVFAISITTIYNIHPSIVLLAFYVILPVTICISFCTVWWRLWFLWKSKKYHFSIFVLLPARWGTACYATLYHCKVFEAWRQVTISIIVDTLVKFYLCVVSVFSNLASVPPLTAI